jgi:hypothetical protein
MLELFLEPGLIIVFICSLKIHRKYIRKWGTEETGCLKIHERRYLI